MLETLLFGEAVDFLEGFGSFLDVCHVLLLLLPKHIRLSCLADHDFDNQRLDSEEDELELRKLAKKSGSHAHALEFIELKAELLIDELIGPTILDVVVDIIFGDGHLSAGLFSPNRQIYED